MTVTLQKPRIDTVKQSETKKETIRPIIREIAFYSASLPIQYRYQTNAQTIQRKYRWPFEGLLEFFLIKFLKY